MQQDVVRVHKRRSRSRTGSTERLLKLTTEQKCDIAQREHDELREEINKFKHETEKILDTYRVGKNNFTYYLVIDYRYIIIILCSMYVRWSS